MQILILEDNVEHRAAMLKHVPVSLPMFGVSFFETSDSFISALTLVASVEIALILLDNDFEPIVRDGQHC